MKSRFDMLTEVDKQTKLFNILNVFSFGNIQNLVQIYLWLHYNDFTMDDLLDNLDFIRKARSGLYASPRYETLNVDDIPYAFLRPLWRLYKRMKSGHLSEEKVHEAYRLARKVNLELTTRSLSQRKKCGGCHKENIPDGVREILR